MMQVPTPFVIAFAQLLQVNQITLLSADNDTTDSQAANLVQILHQSSQVNIKTARESDVPTNCKLWGQENSLIIVLMNVSVYNLDSESCYHGNLKWLTFADNSDTEPPNPLRFDSEYYKASEMNHQKWILEESYSIKGQKFSGPVGTWSELDGLSVKETDIWDRRKPNATVNLKISTMLLKSVERDQSGSLTGLIPQILQMIQKQANMNLTWTIPPDLQYGAPLENGSWSGIVGMVQRNEVDVGAAFLAATQERSEVVTFSVAIIEGHSTLIIANPNYFNRKSISVNMEAFARVFTPLAWIIGLLTLVLIGFTSFFIYSFEPNQEAKKRLTKIQLSNVTKAVAFSYKSLLQMGVDQDFERLAGKLLILVASLTMTVYMGYEGLLTSYLTATGPSQKIESLIDALDQGYSLKIIEGTKHDTELKNALPGSMKHEVYERAVKNNPNAYLPSVEAVADEIIKSPNVAFYGASLAFQQQELLTLANVERARVEYAGLAFPKNSEFLGFFNHHIVKMYQAGVIQFLKRKWLHNRRPFDDLICPKIEDAQPLGFTSTGFLIAVLCTGIVLAPAMLVMEWLVKSHDRIDHE